MNILQSLSSKTILQGGYYIATGLWPVISMSTFEGLTGKKTDDWLVKMVGLLALVIGLELVRRELAEESSLCLGALSAAAFAAIDANYALKGHISKIYFVDCLLELYFATKQLTRSSNQKLMASHAAS